MTESICDSNFNLLNTFGGFLLQSFFVTLSFFERSRAANSSEWFEIVELFSDVLFELFPKIFFGGACPFVSTSLCARSDVEFFPKCFFNNLSRFIISSSAWSSSKTLAECARFEHEFLTKLCGLFSLAAAWSLSKYSESLESLTGFSEGVNPLKIE